MMNPVNNTESLAARWARLPDTEHDRLIEEFRHAEDRANGRRDSFRDDTLACVEEDIARKETAGEIARELGITDELVAAYVAAADALVAARREAVPEEEEVELVGF